MKNKILFVVFMMIFMMSSVVLASVEVPEYIRVGLYYGSTATSNVKLKSNEGMLVVTKNGEDIVEIEEIDAGKEITIKKGSDWESVNVSGIGDIGDDDNTVCIIPNENEDGIKIIYVNGKRYRGDVEIKRYPDSDMTVINYLTMQEYLYGVVPREIGGNSPMEAVKAQAIIARTYATKNYNKRIKWGYNMNPTVDDQAYGGYEWENANSNKAVDETYGMVVTYEDKLIGGYYFSTSGGYTEDCENVWGGSFDYLQAVPDTYEPTGLKMTTWSVEYTAEEIKEKLASRNIDIGEIKNIIPTKFSDVGRVIELKIVGSKDELVLSKEKARTYLGLYSQWYTVNSEPPKAPTIIAEEKEENKEIKPLLQKLINVLTGQETQTAKISLTQEKKITYGALTEKGVFLIQGRGWGHAVGMSQNGAIGMANNDFTCEEIIKWYYSNTEIQK